MASTSSTPSSSPDLSQFDPLAAHPFTSYSTPSPDLLQSSAAAKIPNSSPTVTRRPSSSKPTKPHPQHTARGPGGIFTSYTAKSIIDAPLDKSIDDNLGSILKRKSSSKTPQTSRSS